ncbi:MAG: hypothetical protein ACRDTD_20805, partial [Pseudonocardiaceae bacterium]
THRWRGPVSRRSVVRRAVPGQVASALRRAWMSRSGSAGPGVPAQPPEQGTDVAVIKGVADVGAQPEPLGDAKRIKRTRHHEPYS